MMSELPTNTDLVSLLAEAIGAAARGDKVRVFSMVAEVYGRLSRELSQPTLPGMPAPEPDVGKDEARRAAVSRLFRYWQERCNHGQAKLTPERGRCVMARLRDGYTEAEVRKAIDGAAVAAYVSEENGQKYDDLTLICRNGSKLESFIERGVKATGEIPQYTTGDVSPVEEQISQLRRDMATYRKDGRVTEYNNAEVELGKLMARRKAK